MTADDGVVQVTVVVVTFQPEVRALSELLSALAPQVAHIHLIDNTPTSDGCVDKLLSALGCNNIDLVRLGGNLGIAKALNIGIASARERGATHVLLSDQDSLPDASMVRSLLEAQVRLVAEGVRVGAVAPSFIDRNTGIAFPFQASVPGKFLYGHLRPQPPDGVVEALTLITSGMLIPMPVLDDVGDMREDFFIDHVDIEWCHRARSRGWRLFGSAAATMQHSMGDEDALRVWYFGWRREAAYPPSRMYYRIRNFIALCRLDFIDWRWKVRNAWYWLGFLYSHVVFGPTKGASLAMAWRGLVDGILGRSGRIPDHYQR